MRESDLESVVQLKDPGVEEHAWYDAVELRKSRKMILSGKSVLWQAVGRHRCRILDKGERDIKFYKQQAEVDANYGDELRRACYGINRETFLLDSRTQLCW